jgi:predicted ATPase with chaperone activity
MLLPVGHAGPLGAGKSMLARRLTTILPDLTLAEAIETTPIPRVAGLTGRRTAFVTTRPCRAPHQPMADGGLIGGGHISMRGEVSWAHPSVFLSDELPACTRYGLDALRQPREPGCRDAHTHNRPARPAAVGWTSADTAAARSLLPEEMRRVLKTPSSDGTHEPAG